MYGISRRSVLLTLGATAVPAPSFAVDPWDGKEPSQWTEKEIHKILADSPWAKPVSISLGSGGSPMGGGRGGRGGRGGGGGASSGAGMPDASSSTSMGGAPMGGEAGSPMGGSAAQGGGPAPSITFIIRWQSALPVKQAYVRARMGAEAETSPQAKAFVEREEKQYVIVVEGSMPMRGDGRPGGPEGQGPAGGERKPPSEEMMNRVKESTTLSWKGHEGLHPEAVQLPQPGQTITVLRFPKTHPVELEDKEVEFAMKRGDLEIKRKFRLKDMVYKGQLAL
jgi:hypothetical protein